MDPKIQKLIDDVYATAKQHGVEIKLHEDRNTIDYNGQPNNQVNGFFVESPSLKLEVGTNKPLISWLRIFIHESCHMDQWIEGCQAWKDSVIDGKETIDYIDEWVNGKELDDNFLAGCLVSSRNVELDCERRTIEKIKKYNLNDGLIYAEDLSEEIQMANSYIFFYSALYYMRRWNSPGKSPHLLKEVYKHFPTRFLPENEYSIFGENVIPYIRLYSNHCY